MKAHTNEFKNEVKLLGKQQDSIITYELDGETIELGSEELNSITPHYQGSILKSVMRQLDIDSNVNIPLNTVINCQYGIKVRDDEVEDYRENYDYINYGNYIVYSSEKQEDKNSYKIICYDKMLYSMVDYQNIGINYPILVKDYINAICQYLGLTFKNVNDTFANYNRQINGELYLDNEGNSLNYKFRDVLDELAQVTASTICINEDDDELEIRYITDTHDTIDEEYLKDINVNFGEKYGPINSIVLSRSAETDNVYIQDETSVEQNGLCEIKIIDNQIMNWNDRSDYLPDILSRLGGLEYYLNNFSSTGIMYYNLCDRYTVHIGENDYSCVMFNDEANITQGLQERIYTERPSESETDYSKADKTDRKINQTYLIVDKQNNAIEGMSSQITDQNEQIATIRLQYNELLSRISDIADITTSGESSYASVNLVDVNASQPITIRIRPIGENISYLYPSTNLYPSDTLYMKSRILRFTNTTTNEIFEWELPTDLWYYNSTTYDELELSYGDGTNSNVIVTRKCKINADGTISVLETPTTETYSYPNNLYLTDGDYTATLLGYTGGYLYVQLMAKNIYTTQFYTKVETNSLIDQTASSINLSVNQKLSNYSTTNEMNSAITLKANEITSSVSETYATKTTTNQLSSRISQTAKSIDLSVTDNGTSAGLNIKVKNEDGTQIDEESANITLSGLVKFTDLSTSGSTTINGANIQTGTLSASKITTGTLNGNNVSITNLNASNITGGTLSANRISGGTINGNNVSITNLSASNIRSGSLTSTSVKIGSWNLNGTGLSSSSVQLYPSASGFAYYYNNAWQSVSWRGLGLAGTAYSDKKLKKNIKKLDDKYDKFFDELKPVNFDYKKKIKDNKKHIGFIAQDIQKAQKDNNLEDLSLVYEDDYLCLDKREIIALNTWQIQKLKKENKELKDAIDELRKEMEELKNERM